MYSYDPYANVNVPGTSLKSNISGKISGKYKCKWLIRGALPTGQYFQKHQLERQLDESFLLTKSLLSGSKALSVALSPLAPRPRRGGAERTWDRQRPRGRSMPWGHSWCMYLCKYSRVVVAKSGIHVQLGFSRKLDAATQPEKTTKYGAEVGYCCREHTRINSPPSMVLCGVSFATRCDCLPASPASVLRIHDPYP